MRVAPEDQGLPGFDRPTAAVSANTHTHTPGIDRAAAVLDWPKRRPEGIVVVNRLVLIVVECASSGD